MPRHVNERHTVNDLTNWELALIEIAVSSYVKNNLLLSEEAIKQANALVDKINAVGV